MYVFVHVDNYGALYASIPTMAKNTQTGSYCIPQ